MKSGFLINENLPASLGSILVQGELTAKHVLELGLGGKPDSKIWAHAVKNSAVVVTKDVDYLDLVFGSDVGSVIHVAVGNLRIADLKALVLARKAEISSFMSSEDRVLVIRS